MPQSFNAARGYSLSPPPPLRGPPPPLAQGRLFVYGTPASLPDAQNQDCCKAPSQREGLRYFSFPRRCGGSGERSEPIGAPMPHAALWVVQQRKEDDFYDERKFQCRTQHCMWCNCAFQRVQCGTKSFNAARSIVCGATKFVNLCQHPINVFQCRTQHDMWCNTSSLFFSRKEVKVSMPHAA